MKQKQKLLLLEDVHNLGKKGEIVAAKSGFFRNFLLPKRKAVIATVHTLRQQEKLQKEREERSVIDRKESEELKKKLEAMTLEVTVKVDPEGNLYGSVSPFDILHLLKEQGITLERHQVVLPKPIKAIGSFHVPLKLKEGIEAKISIKVHGEGQEAPIAIEEETEEKNIEKKE